MVGDSAGGNLIVSVNIRLIELNVKRLPDGIVPIYTPFLFQVLNYYHFFFFYYIKYINLLSFYHRHQEFLVLWILYFIWALLFVVLQVNSFLIFNI